MRWTPGGESGDIEDRRGDSGGGGGFGLLGGRSLGLVGTLVVLGLSLVFHQNFFALLGGGSAQDQSQSGQPSAPVQSTPAQDKQVQFVSFVIDDVQNTWTRLLPAAGAQYQHAKLVLFRNGIQSGCGFAQSSMGPFYCPTDRKVYLDLGFFDELRGR
jgi:predicted metalloprotease